MRFKVNTANGNQLLSIGFGATGAFEDTTNSDAVVAGDEVNYQVVTSGAAGAIELRIMQVAYIATVRKTMTGSHSPDAHTVDRFLGAENDGTSSTAEVDSQIAARAAFTANNMFVNVTARSATGTVDIFLRQNGVSSALTVNIPTSTTGFFEDTVNSVSIAVADTYNFLVDVGGVLPSVTAPIIGFANGPTDVISGGGKGYPSQMNNRRGPRGRARGLKVIT